MLVAVVAWVSFAVNTGAADAKAVPAEGKAALTETNKPVAKVEFPKSVFVYDVKDKKGYKDPFFPKTQRFNPPPPPPPKPPAQPVVNNPNPAPAPAPPPPPPPPPWYEGWTLRGVIGVASTRIASVHSGSFAYTFREGQTRVGVQTPKGPVTVTCVKILEDSVELRVEGEKDPGVLELSSR